MRPEENRGRKIKWDIRWILRLHREAKARPINEIAGALGIPEKYIENYGPCKAKIDYRYYNDALKDRPDAKLGAGDSHQSHACR